LQHCGKFTGAADMSEHHTMTRGEHKRKAQILTQPGPSKLPGSYSGAVLKSADLFLVADAGGDVPWALPHAFGLYYRDTRFVNGLTLRLQHTSLVPLGNMHFGGHDAAIDLANRTFRDERGVQVPQHTVCARRERRLYGGVLHERIQLTNYHDRAVRVRLDVRFRCGFEDVFVVKKFVEQAPQRARPDVVSPRHAVWHYRGIDAMSRASHIVFDQTPAQLDADRANFVFDIDPDGTACVSLAVTPVIEHDGRDVAGPRRIESLDTRLDRADRLWLDAGTRIASSNELFDRVFSRAIRDLRLLRSRLGRCHYFAAGIPWFATLFGRDAAIVALQTLPYGNTIARETLELLARHQADEIDSYRDAEPGKILHEMRRGELARAGEIPQSPSYFGTVDATPLFIILFAEYVLWSGDVEFARRHQRAIENALQWISARVDRDGYLRYDGEYASGLVNQGWKDSGNAIVNADGSLAEPPIALAEVQGYVFRAWHAARLLRRAIDGRSYQIVDGRVQDLARRFDRDFWSDEIGCYVLALQGDDRPAAVVSSNAGQVLWSGIASSGRARRMADRLLEDDMFSGWGIRTLSQREERFNPVSYHLGSVWPHDNGIILAGFRRYGLDDAATRVFDALLDAAIEFHGRLPELFCGFPRREHESPVPYPSASSPQAWAAGSLPHGLWNLLGLQPNALEERLDVRRPTLPERLYTLTLTSMRVGRALVDLRFERRDGRVSVDAEVRDGRLDIRVTDDAIAPDS
jgi:glycogen debranching enzyme